MSHEEQQQSGSEAVRQSIHQQNKIQICQPPPNQSEQDSLLHSNTSIQLSWHISSWPTDRSTRILSINSLCLCPTRLAMSPLICSNIPFLSLVRTVSDPLIAQSFDSNNRNKQMTKHIGIKHRTYQHNKQSSHINIRCTSERFD